MKMSKAELKQWVEDNWDKEYVKNPFDMWIMIDNGEVTTIEDMQQYMVEL